MDENTKQSDGKDVNETPNTSITKKNIELNSVSKFDFNLLDRKQVDNATYFLDKIIRSEKGGIKNVNDGLAILMRAQGLNIPFSTAIEHIHVINGKTGVDVHVIKALLSRAGVTWRCINDYSPLYEYTDGINVYIDGKLPDYVIKCKSQKEAEEKRKTDLENISEYVYVYPVTWYSDFNGNMYRNYNLNNKFAIAINSLQASEIAKSGKIPIYRIPAQPVDYITKYEFTRTIRNKEVTCISSFSYTEAQTAGMFEKETYKKYPKVLISHRAFTYGARDIASDVIMGCMETTELKIVTDKNITDDDLQFTDAIEID